MTDKEIKELMTVINAEMDKRFEALTKEIMAAKSNMKQDVPETPEVQPEQQAAQAAPQQVSTPQPVQIIVPETVENTTPRSKLKTAGLIIGATAAIGAIGYFAYKIGSRNSGGYEYGSGGCDPIGMQPQPQLGMNQDPYDTVSYDSPDSHIRGLTGLDADGFLID